MDIAGRPTIIQGSGPLTTAGWTDATQKADYRMFLEAVLDPSDPCSRDFANKIDLSGPFPHGTIRPMPLSPLGFALIYNIRLAGRNVIRLFDFARVVSSVEGREKVVRLKPDLYDLK